MLFLTQQGCGMSRLNGKAKEVLDACLSGESPAVRAKVYEIIDVSGLDPSDPMFLILALTGQMRVLLEAAPADLSKLLNDWKQQASRSFQEFQRAIAQVEATREQEAETIRLNLERVASDCVEDIKEVGAAATSAIASANSETLSQASLTATAAAQLTNAVVALIDKVDSDRANNEKVLQALLKQVLDATTGLNTAVNRTAGMHNAMDKLQNKIRLSTAFGSLAPLTTLGIATVAGGVIWAMVMHFYWGDAQKYLSVIKENQAAFDRCFTRDDEGNIKTKPGITCKVTAVPDKSKK